MPHLTIDKAQKYVARLKHTIVLVNGGMFDPMIMEGTICSHKATTETVMFGAARPYLEMLVGPSFTTISLSDDEIINQTWPMIEEADQTAEACVRITRHMIG